MEVLVWQNGDAYLDVRNLWCAPEKEIFHAIAEAFDTEIVTEHQPEYWGFDTQEKGAHSICNKSQVRWLRIQGH
jgi:hypothetical protein